MSQIPDITDRARASLDRMMVQGLRHGIAGDAPDADIAAADLPARSAATRMVVLSIASYTFRIITALHFNESQQLKAHIAQLGQRSPDAMTHQDFIDAVCEAGNMCCGAINRELGAFYNGLGLSTPQILDIRSLPHMQRLGAQHLRHFRINLADDLHLHASLCVRAYEPMDFDWHAQEPAVGAGELELF
ncbi:chemotaxis protein CheX [Diaphorobacter nitroreducens]|uniref:chemotaxis protein CheX n=1 Tax=Diaphorobacter nitroreducens TaxID=164759 RepID=UPI0024E1EC1B|nr:hypothetical protein [Diaphorobacter nitroreducens]